MKTRKHFKINNIPLCFVICLENNVEFAYSLKMKGYWLGSMKNIRHVKLHERFFVVDIQILKIKKRLTENYLRNPQCSSICHRCENLSF